MLTDTSSLYDKLRTSGMLDEFRELMFAQQLHYDELLTKLEEWGISSSMGALSRFKAAHVGQWSMERAIDAERDFLKEHGADLDEATRKLIALRVFNLAANPDTPTKDVLKMKDLLIREANMKLSIEKLQNDIRQRDRALEQKDRDLEQRERRIAALETAGQQIKQVSTDPVLSPEEMRERVMRIVDESMGIKH